MTTSNIWVIRAFASPRLSAFGWSFFSPRLLRHFPFLFCLVAANSQAQTLNLKSAINAAMENYGTIKAKSDYLRSSQAAVKQAAVDFLPAISVGAQQAYGTINGQFGPLIASGGLNAASSGPPFQDQNWHAAFGGLYLANINWDFFTFGRVKEKVRVAEAEQRRNAGDLEQEKFQHKVRVAAVYLNLLAGHRLRLAQQKNVDRADALRVVVQARTKNGLNPGVDSSLANAELSNAKIALTNAINYEQEQAAQLAQLIGIPYQEFVLDTLFINRIPSALFDSATTNQDQHPLLQFYQRRLEVSKEQEKYYDRLKYPVFSLIGVLQARGTGFEYDYNELNPAAYSSKYWTGIKPTRSNYLVGMGVTWNLTNIKRVQHQVQAQEFTSKGLQSEYELVSQQVRTQLALADQQMKNAVANYQEAPVQMKAASDAYLQKSVLYRNGLATIVDVTVALYTLNRAETDRDIANNNVWQALLLKAAASGDFGLFLNEF